MCRSDGLIGVSSTRTSASPGAKGGVGISASFNTLFGSPISRKINTFINTSWVFRRRLLPAGCSTTSGTRTGAGDEGERLRRSWEMLHAFAEPNLPQCHSGQTVFAARRHVRGGFLCTEGSYRETRYHWYPQTAWENPSLSALSRAELEITASVHSSRLDEAVCSH